jgi:hypothetical protein
MEKKVTGQKIKKTFAKPIDIATKYYSLLSLLNDLYLTDREIQLIAHIAIKGTISTVPSKEEFIKTYKTSKDTLNNLVSKLSRRGFLIKKNKMIRLHPALVIDFTSDELIIKIRCILQKESTT